MTSLDDRQPAEVFNPFVRAACPSFGLDANGIERLVDTAFQKPDSARYGFWLTLSDCAKGEVDIGARPERPSDRDRVGRVDGHCGCTIAGSLSGNEPTLHISDRNFDLFDGRPAEALIV